MTKSSWNVLLLDKKLLLVPLLAFLASLAVFIPYFGIIFLSYDMAPSGDGSHESGGILEYLMIPFWLSLYLVLGFISTFSTAVVIDNALKRFAGQPHSLKGSFRAAWAKKGSLAAFSVLSTTIGLVLGFIEERIPFGGKVVAWLVSASWTIATLFAIPAILHSKEYIGPFDATKQSIATIKKVWGEGVVSQLAISLIAGITMITLGFAYFAVFVGSLIALDPLHYTYAIMPVTTLFFAVLIGLSIIFNTLIMIARAALYHFAVTGEAPSTFDSELLRSTMTPKKARKLFS